MPLHGRRQIVEPRKYCLVCVIVFLWHVVDPHFGDLTFMHFLQLFLPGVAAMSSHVSIPVWLLWHQMVESRIEYDGGTWRGILEGGLAGR